MATRSFPQTGGEDIPGELRARARGFLAGLPVGPQGQRGPKARRGPVSWCMYTQAQPPEVTLAVQWLPGFPWAEQGLLGRVPRRAVWDGWRELEASGMHAAPLSG